METVTQERFEKELSELAEKNWKVKGLIRDFGGWNNLPTRIQDMIDSMLGIVRTNQTLTRK
ncbi:MAG: hypothetical protein PHT07_21475 [Paludibacter sp.]|nr:hypothetical protein [Paludibacter sp.]